VVARVNGLEELTEWLAAAAGQGADRFELWIKQRGCDSAHVKTAEHREPFDIADELLATIERDRRAEPGQVAFAVYAFRGTEPAPFDRAILQSGSRAIVTPFGMHATAVVDGAGPALAITSLLGAMQHMTQEVFGTLQRENESQRRTNETVMRSSTSHFETLTKSYERTFGDLQHRYDAALRENAELRSQNEALVQQNKTSQALYEDLHRMKMDELGKQERKTKREDVFMENLKLIGPVLVSKFTKQPLDPTVVGVPGFEQFVASLKPAQVQGILSLLEPVQAMFLIELLQGYQARAGAASAAGPPPEQAPGVPGEAAPPASPPEPAPKASESGAGAPADAEPLRPANDVGTPSD
jgi:hypothetical protein